MVTILDRARPETGSGPRKPAWIRVRAPTSEGYHDTRRLIRGKRLHTVCEEAACPNIGECWTQVRIRRSLQLPTSSTSRRGGYSCGFDLCLSPKGHSRWTASKRLSAEGHLFEGSPQLIDPAGKNVGNCKRLTGTLRAV